MRSDAEREVGFGKVTKGAEPWTLEIRLTGCCWRQVFGLRSSWRHSPNASAIANDKGAAMIINYRKEAGEDAGRWSFAWDGPAMIGYARDGLVIAACCRYLGFL